VFWIRFELNADSDPSIKLNAAADPDLSFDICASHRKKFHIFSPSFHIFKFKFIFLITPIRYLFKEDFASYKIN
jgi:hypothetical protein